MKASATLKKTDGGNRECGERSLGSVRILVETYFDVAEGFWNREVTVFLRSA
jgi:hypothetical protein